MLATSTGAGGVQPIQLDSVEWGADLSFQAPTCRRLQTCVHVRKVFRVISGLLKDRVGMKLPCWSGFNGPLACAAVADRAPTTSLVLNFGKLRFPSPPPNTNFRIQGASRCPNDSPELQPIGLRATEKHEMLPEETGQVEGSLHLAWG